MSCYFSILITSLKLLAPLTISPRYYKRQNESLLRKYCNYFEVMTKTKHMWWLYKENNCAPNKDAIFYVKELLSIKSYLCIV